MIPIYSRRVRQLPYRKRMYKGGTLFMGPPILPDYHWVQSALAAQKRPKRKKRQ